MSSAAVTDRATGELADLIAAEAEDDPSESAPAGTASGTPAKPEKGLWSYLGLALSAALLLLVVALAAVTIVIPKLAGALPMTVLTSSMEPGLPPGTLIIVKPINVDELAIGDVATYQIESGKPGVITHRIIGINLLNTGGRTFEFMGDNNGFPDTEAVREVQIQGKLWYSIPLIGWVNNLVNGANKVWIVPVIAGLLFAYAGYTVVSSLAAANRARRKRRRLAAEALTPATVAPVTLTPATVAPEPTAAVEPEPLAPAPADSGGGDAQHELSAGVPLLEEPVGQPPVDEVEDLFHVRAYDA